MNCNKWLLKNCKDLSGKIVIITGANSGIGFFATKFLAGLNAEIIMACRNEKKAESARQEILQENPNAKLTIMNLDLSSKHSILSFVKAIKQKYNSIFCLVNNAGVYFPSSEKTTDGLEFTIGTNYIGTYILTEELLPQIEENGKIIIVTSLTDKKSKFVTNDLFNEKTKSKNKSYGRSKLYLSAYSLHLSENFYKENKKLHSITIHPGITATNILNPSKTAFSKLFANAGNLFLKIFVHSPKKASLTIVKAVADNNVKNGDRIVPCGPFEISGKPKKGKYSKKIIKQKDNIIQETKNFLKNFKSNIDKETNLA